MLKYNIKWSKMVVKSMEKGYDSTREEEEKGPIGK